jgi:prevent-host-death family protein
MREVGSYEAKTHLAQLLEDVEGGETITITRHGHPVARLVPARPQRHRTADVIAAIKSARAGVTLGDLTARELIDAGRR